MKKILAVLSILMLLSLSTLASTETKISIISCEVDLKISKYDNDTQIILDIKDEEGNKLTNIYTKQQVRQSNKEYSYLLEGSNCIYLNETDYGQVKEAQRGSFWGWFIFVSLLALLALWINGAKSY